MVGNNRFASRISHETDDSYFTTGTDLLGKCTRNDRSLIIDNNQSKTIQIWKYKILFVTTVEISVETEMNTVVQEKGK